MSVQYVPAVLYQCVKSFLLVCFQFPFHFRNYDRAVLQGMEEKTEKEGGGNQGNKEREEKIDNEVGEEDKERRKEKRKQRGNEVEGKEEKEKAKELSKHKQEERK